MILIDKAFIINENKSYVGSILIDGERIKAIYRQDVPIEVRQQSEVIDAGGFYLMPGVIDDQVHFRDPGFTYKGDLFTESRAAVAGGVTSFMDMPNTNPQTVTIDALERKFEAA
ncbi:MAG TPA: dihydroorotase, partial [Porphyromonadaceae bacterium]|nr:dihydroorotase [Porphyromonadaceae bacterium]